ncbi:unnamed protein product, partial [Musa hybrid cultivar]
MLQVSEHIIDLLIPNRNRSCATNQAQDGSKSSVHVAFGGYLIAFLTIFLVAASPRSIPHTSESLIRYNRTSESSSPTCSFSESFQLGSPFATSPLHMNISASSPTSPTMASSRFLGLWYCSQSLSLANSSSFLESSLRLTSVTLASSPSITSCLSPSISLSLLFWQTRGETRELTPLQSGQGSRHKHAYKQIKRTPPGLQRTNWWMGWCKWTRRGSSILNARENP